MNWTPADVNTMRRNLTAQRTGESPAQRAYAGMRCRIESDGGWRSYALAVAIGIAIGVILALGV